ncbi:MAG: endopeptidase La [Bacteroidales bacterium]|nr:endopeptidase La [Bacteroidales bacterium]MBN2756830.1 endopeptidase La [Bacteroidales bacterium]
MDDLLFSGALENGSDFIPIMSENEEDDINGSNIPEILPILTLKNTVLFSGVIIPIAVGRKKSIRLIKSVYKKEKLIGIITQKDSKIDDPQKEDLYEIGTMAQIVKVLEMPDNSTTVIIQGLKRFKIDEYVREKPYFQAKVSELADIFPAAKDKEFEAITTSLKETAIDIIDLSSHIPKEAVFAIKNIESPRFLINFICSNSDLLPVDKQKLLEIDDLKKRAISLLEHLATEVQKLELKDNIQSKVKLELDQQQKEYFLNQQIKAIQNELGKDPIDIEIEELKKKAKKKKWGKDAKEMFNKSIAKIQRTNSASPEYGIELSYLQTLVELPWNFYTKDNFDLKRAEKILDEDHFGLDKVKERILEHLAVLKLKGDLKAPILCLLGPPGVGKTSLGKSIATAINRKYARISLGGLHDEAEIRGHRKTYIGAMPGRIIQSIKKVKSSNPVFILDEIDKVGNDFRGDPSSALLEVLDPEQNIAFYDNYLELEYDLSKVMFIATANTLGPINPALRDRMEIIDISGYIIEEKIEIAKKHLLPKQIIEHGLKKDQIVLSKNIFEQVIVDYTRESGVRQLDKVLAKLVRKIAKKLAFEEDYNPKLTTEDIVDFLGQSRYSNNTYQGNEYAGVVTGLAWTAVGGQILMIEASLSKGNGKLTLTGNLGNVMKESAVIALEYLKANNEILGIEQDIFDNWNIHLHVPEGAIPKDGPSAGITMATALASVFSQRKIKKNIAMTGEITLRGKVLPVGGIKEKILAAKRANIKEIILSIENKKDILEIKDIYIQGLKFHYVDNIREVLEISILKQKITNPKKLDVKKE